MSGEVRVGVETERKYDVPTEASIPHLASLGYEVEFDRFALRADYYDTRDHVLAQNRITLRRREGGHDSGWHLKTPGDDGRVEHQAPLGTDQVPAELRGLIADLIGDAELVPVVELQTDRTTATLVAGEVEVAEIADDRVTGRRVDVGETRVWREWEAELLSDAPAGRDERAAVLDRIEERLLAAGAVPSPAASKLARALGREPLPTF
ncbi:CYTH domain-containing protein [Herbiconiux sp. L3-i23]|uniref:CYTH domain-containing protein n=1 Tax=Herbiconiux sp. L3-i23 TaxID=2905871 RepID=UPI0020699A95|nr:CYTH domain-containing protein [Herbiconiux sp. L3-i23]BDI22875.1 hypothetical protein L3i23_16510 [Herbiconiux sp. L3-i23]